MYSKVEKIIAEIIKILIKRATLITSVIRNIGNNRRNYTCLIVNNAFEYLTIGIGQPWSVLLC